MLIFMTIPFVDLWRFCKALGLCKMPPAFWRQGTNGVWNSSRAIHNRFTFKLLPFLRPNALPFAIPVFVPVFGAFLPYLRLVRCLFQYSTAPGGFQYISWQKFFEWFSKSRILRSYHCGIIHITRIIRYGRKVTHGSVQQQTYSYPQKAVIANCTLYRRGGRWSRP